ncbi:MAG TPA: metal-dependent transcriptional regulator [Solirubrobacteraceae bacterium]|jgi:DtxR family Mn-dependent transcriptional regulator|nr:metal-dependent transcriptional regulator [Solirubrobacteraceae bacterium]
MAVGKTLSPAVEDYTKALYALEVRTGDPVSTNAVAERMGVSAASASGMLKKLAELGLVSHAPYRGSQLTPAGRRVALEVLRHHRLLELFLAEALDVPWDQVHREAEVLEHVLSEELEELISDRLGHPTFDPHGDPIPTPELELDEGATESLQVLEVGERAALVRVSDADPALLRFLSDRGIAPGVTLEVVDKHPFDGPLFVRVDDEVHVLGGRVARAMRVVREER